MLKKTCCSLQPGCKVITPNTLKSKGVAFLKGLWGSKGLMYVECFSNLNVASSVCLQLLAQFSQESVSLGKRQSH